MLHHSYQASPLSSVQGLFQPLPLRFERFIDFLAQAALTRSADEFLHSHATVFRWCRTCRHKLLDTQSALATCENCINVRRIYSKRKRSSLDLAELGIEIDQNE
jgi:hypothetical protein